MASVGRGRGRVSHPAPLRRPGQQPNPPDYIMSMNALVPDIIQGELVDVVMNQVAAACSTPAAAHDVVETIYNYSIKNRNFAKVAGEILARIIALDKEGCKKAVMDKLQCGYDEREVLFATTAGSELTNFACLLGFFYNKAMLRTGVPVRIVAEPLAVCLNMAVNRTTPRIEVFAEQLVINGDKLLEHSPNCLEQLISKAREILVLSDPPVEKIGLMYLLLCIELHSNKFQHLSDAAVMFYEKQLASRQVPSVIQRLKEMAN